MSAATLSIKERILVIDDEEPIREAMRDYFTSIGYIVDCAQELEEAQALLTHVSYSVVIADLRLTSVNKVEGLEVIGFVKERFPATRIILLTAYGSPEVEREAKRRGVDAFLLKPKPLPVVAQIVFGFSRGEA